ncbi:MAG: copper chaperone PCu(A)C [Pseudomonadota bacterium]|jgi:copper(I)-binding protein|nr:copper chaperone PCu(A)C [Pseudomonadota bacterium]
MQPRITAFAPSPRALFSAFAALLLSLAGAAAYAEVTVADAWARATVPQQKASGAFMTLTASTDTRLIGVSSPAAGVAEIHEMKMDGNIMRMNPIDALALPAGKAVELRPGGYHLMLMQLPQPLEAGTEIPVSLTFEDAAGQRTSLDIQVPVKPLTTPAHGGSSGHGHGHRH